MRTASTCPPKYKLIASAMVGTFDSSGDNPSFSSKCLVMTPGTPIGANTASFALFKSVLG